MLGRVVLVNSISACNFVNELMDSVVHVLDDLCSHRNYSIMSYCSFFFLENMIN